MKEWPIDFVIPWVDDSDPQWLAEKAKYVSGVTQKDAVDANEYRYRDWDTLRYWFRGVEKFAPWVRKIHFITCGHIPQWLDVNHPKLHLVKHSDYIPGEYLPTFSAHPIELNIHRIPGLSERFVYFNDDMFIIRPVMETCFFRNGKPCQKARMLSKVWDDLDDAFSYILFNDRTVIFRNFPHKKKIVLKHLAKWLSPENGLTAARDNLIKILQSKFIDFEIPHSHASFLKSTFFTVWEKEKAILEKTCSHKFRSVLDVNQYLFQEWQIMSGNFAPAGIDKMFRYFDTFPRDIDALKETILRQSRAVICVNDTQRNSDFTGTKEAVIRAFDTILPDKSAFEVF